MNTLLSFWILILACLPMSDPAVQSGLLLESPLTKTLVSSQLDAGRQKVETTLQRLEEGVKKTDRKYKALLNMRAENWKPESEYFYNQSKRLENTVALLQKAQMLLKTLQEAKALPKPNLNTIPDEMRQYLLDGSPKLAQGAPGYGPGFERACPAFDGNDLDAFNGTLGDSGLSENLAGSNGLRMPAAGTISAGTWAYPGGGLHLGMDLALRMYTPVYAPADGIILYAAAPVGDAGGYLGNWCGWPYGGGNTIAMIGKANDKLYGITFCHLSSRIQVRAGQQIHQGDLIAYSGNTGNSTGPHTHIELFSLKVSAAQAIAYFQQGADFSFGTGWDTPGTCSWLACRIRPELYF
ncbi:M23 family metallopeptidase [Erysipelotrichaceae bacterium RD49]|nr:M23 family metallopeptidase [Erysipelotrichaceae bacterium RD49]